MNSTIYTLLFTALLALSGFTTYTSLSAWTIGNDYSVKFTSEDPTGIFSKMDGTILFDENDLSASKFDMSIDASSISTGNGMKNKHAKSDKWFNVEEYPKITFVSNNISKAADGYTVTGKLNMHGVEKEISFPFTFADNTFKGSFEVNRLDYNIGSTKGMQGKASTDLRVDVSVPVSK